MGEAVLTPMLERAIEAAKALPEAEQDALAAEILEWTEDQRRWAESFARTHEALAELAREALAAHHASETLDEAYAEMASDADRESETAERTESLFADADHDDEPPTRCIVIEGE